MRLQKEAAQQLKEQDYALLSSSEGEEEEEEEGDGTLGGTARQVGGLIGISYDWLIICVYVCV